VLVFTQVGVHADVEIELHLATADGESAWIEFGRNEGLVVDFNDVDSLERLAAVAAEGAQLLQARIEDNRAAAARERSGEADQLVIVGVA
jgi:hypothetical protein